MNISRMKSLLFYTDLLFPGSTPPLTNAMIETDETGAILSIVDSPTRELIKKAQYYPGAIAPGFINAHCHTELSMFNGSPNPGSGMAEFIKSIASQRTHFSVEEQKIAMRDTLENLYNQGVSAIGDICNTSVSFDLKSASPILFHNFIEIFGLNPLKSDAIINEALQLLNESGKFECGSGSLTPHAPYSLSSSLISLLKPYLAASSQPISLHLAESQQEIELFKSRTGGMADLFEKTGMLKYLPDEFKTPIDFVKHLIPRESRLLAVHNTELSQSMLDELKQEYSNLTLCLCPTSNQYINQTSPKIEFLHSSGVPIVIGTDSKASNPQLSMAKELMEIQRLAPELPVWIILKWATFNGAQFFGWKELGKIKPGNKPGLVWLKGMTTSVHFPDEGLITERII